MDNRVKDIGATLKTLPDLINGIQNSLEEHIRAALSQIIQDHQQNHPLMTEAMQINQPEDQNFPPQTPLAYVDGNDIIDQIIDDQTKGETSPLDEFFNIWNKITSNNYNLLKWRHFHHSHYNNSYQHHHQYNKNFYLYTNNYNHYQYS